MSAIALLCLSLPFWEVGGEPLARFDFPRRTVFLLGGAFPFDSLFPLLLIFLAGLFSLLFVAAAFGRLWCGWACPQTLLSEFGEVLGEKLGASAAGKLFFHAAALASSALLAFSFCAYFTDPSQIVRAAPGGTAFLLFLVLAAVTYVDMVFVGRKFCKVFCPYGKVLTILTATGIQVAVDPERRGECIECGACSRACPMSLEVRTGAGPECVACGRCIVACDKVLVKRSGGGIVNYFLVGEGKRLWGFLPASSMAPLVMVLLLMVGFGALSFTGAEARLQVRVAPGSQPQEADGGIARFMVADLANLTGTEEVYELVAAYDGGDALELRGQVRELKVSAGGRERITFALVERLPAVSGEIVFRLLDRGGAEAANQRIASLGEGDR